MVDEVVRLKATVIADEALATLQRLETRLTGFQRNAGRGAQQAVPHWAALRGQITGVGTALVQATPAAGALNVALLRVAASAGPIGMVATAVAIVGVAAYAATSKLAQFAKGVVEIKHLGEELRMSTREVRAWQAAATQAGVAPQALIQGMQQLRTNLDGLRFAGSSMRQALLQMGGGRQLLRELMQLKPADQIKELFKVKELLISQGKRFEAGELFDASGIGRQNLRLTYDAYERLYGLMRERTPEEEARAEKLHERWVEFGVAIENLKDRVLLPLLPWATAFTNGLITAVGKIDELLTKWGEINQQGGLAEHFTGTYNLRKEFQTPAVPSIPPGQMFKTPPGGIRPPKGFRSGSLIGGELSGTMLGSGGDDRLDTALGSADRGEDVVEEGTYQALRRFYHDQQTLGGGGIAGGGGGGAGGAGGGGGGGTGLGGGQGGSQSSGGSDPSTSKSDETQAAAEGLTTGPKGNMMPSDMVGLERGPPGTGGGNAWGAAGGTDTGTLGMPAGAKLPEGAPAGAAPAAGASGSDAGNTLSREKYEETFKGTPLAGKYDKVVAEAAKNKVPPNVLAGILSFESKKGQHKPAQRRNNFAGLMERKNTKRHQEFKSVDEGLEAAGRSIGNRYKEAKGDIPTMGKAYAPPGASNDPGGTNALWPRMVSKESQRLSQPAPSTPPGSPSVATPATGTSESQTKIASTDPASGISQSTPAGARIPKEQALAIATSQMGLHEVANRDKLREFFRKSGMNIDPATTPWCAAFANTALQQAGLPQSAKGEERYAAKTFMNYGTAVDKKEGPKAGDIAVFQHGGISHVGFLTGKVGKDGKWEVRGGNQSIAGGEKSVAVTNSYFRPDQITRVRRPPAPIGPGAPGAPGAAPQTPLVKPNIGGGVGFGGRSSEAVDRANANQTAQVPPSSVNVDVRHNGTKATAKAETKGPQFADTKVRNQTQGQMTAEMAEA